MKKIVVLSLLALLLSCKTAELTLISENESYGLEVLTVESPSIQKNLVDEPLSKILSVYLPPSYGNGEKQYPVVYFLHGFSGSPLDIRRFKMPLDAYFAANPDDEFIVVGVDGLNRYGGSFFANSTATGNWADFLNIEAIPFIESQYRILSGRENRGLAGFSMGGSGTVNNAFSRPDLYGSMLASGPGLFNEEGLKVALDGWNEGFERAYGSVYSPIVEKGELNGYNTPLMDNSETDKTIADQWEQGFGSVQQKIDSYQAKETPMNIKILCGSYDSYSWIRDGSAHFSELLTEASIDHEYIVFEGGHVFNGILVEDHLIPFFTEHFAY